MCLCECACQSAWHSGAHQFGCRVQDERDHLIMGTPAQTTYSIESVQAHLPHSIRNAHIGFFLFCMPTHFVRARLSLFVCFAVDARQRTSVFLQKVYAIIQHADIVRRTPSRKTLIF